MNEMILRQLIAVRDSARALVSTIDVYVDGVIQEAASATTDTAACMHPLSARLSIGVMGDPGRTLCTICNQELST